MCVSGTEGTREACRITEFKRGGGGEGGGVQAVGDVSGSVIRPVGVVVVVINYSSGRF